MADFGYDVSDYNDVDPIFGNLDDFKELVKAAHARDLHIVVDYVPNHTSDEHPWFLEAKTSKTSAKRNWFIWKDPVNGKPPNNWVSQFGGSSWELDASSNQYYLHSFLKEQPDLEWRNPEVIKAMTDVLRFWLDLGVDGFRIDAIRRLFKHKDYIDNPLNPSGQIKLGKPNPEYDLQFHVNDMHQPEVHDVLRDFRKLLDTRETKQRPLAMVAEVWGDPKDTTTYFGDHDQKEPEFHLVFNFTMMHLPWSAAAFKKCYEDFESKCPKDCYTALVFGSHDEHRLVSRYGDSAARNAALLLLTLRGAPYIYYGDELGMSNGVITNNQIVDPWAIRTNNPQISRDPGRTPMQWNADPKTSFGFTGGDVKPWLPVHDNGVVVNVETELKDPNSLLNLYKRIITYRKQSTALKYGTYRSLATEKNSVPEDVYAYVREHDQSRCLVVVNFAAKEQQVVLGDFATTKNKVAISTLVEGTGGSVSLASFNLKPHEGLLLELN
eukprot:TRINITY_DN14487_c0_g1_i1.p1 TRINITY_DN14487_c0_g1~~TRINITY_DN14487_c0_g1_i1.p1  ORF type:complete len:557 (+),score=143.00 TRINITY_DN14487_c0_g1_i1:192-1673(+)